MFGGLGLLGGILCLACVAIVGIPTVIMVGACIYSEIIECAERRRKRRESRSLQINA